MKWLVIALVVGFLYYYFVLSKGGNIRFWRTVNSNPEEALQFFQGSSAFCVFELEPPGGFRNSLPPGDWDGPFRIVVPALGKTITVFGRVPEYIAEQDRFIRSVHG